MSETNKPSVLAEETIVERKGDDRLDRQVHHVIHHQPPEHPDRVTPVSEADKDVADE